MDEILTTELSCPICYETMISAHVVNCKHSFCELCLKSSLQIRKTCPVCRTPVNAVIPLKSLDQVIEKFMDTKSAAVRDERADIVAERVSQLEKLPKTINFAGGRVYLRAARQYLRMNDPMPVVDGLPDPQYGFEPQIPADGVSDTFLDWMLSPSDLTTHQHFNHADVRRNVRNLLATSLFDNETTTTTVHDDSQEDESEYEEPPLRPPVYTSRRRNLVRHNGRYRGGYSRPN